MFCAVGDGMKSDYERMILERAQKFTFTVDEFDVVAVGGSGRL